jgi:hypothetical protein
MPQVQPRNNDTVDAFEHQGGHPDFWIPAATVTASGLDSDGARWARVKGMTLRDLWHIIGFRTGAPPGDVSNTLKKLQVDDLYAIGRCISSHTGMGYPDKIYTCCCCT